MPAYNFEQVTVTAANSRIGNFIFSGFGEGDDVVNVQRPDDAIAMTTGAKGFVVTSIQANPTGMIDITVQSQSPDNSVLNGLASRKEMFSITVAEKNNQSATYSSTNAYVVKEADSTRGKASTERTWSIMCEELKFDE